MEQPLAPPEQLRLCSHFRGWWVCPRFPKQPGLWGSGGMLSEQVQGVGQGAGLDPAHLEHVLPFTVGPEGSLPCPEPLKPHQRRV